MQTYKVLFILLLSIFSQKASGSNKEQSTLELMVNSPMAYDIALRKEVIKSLTQQDEFNRRLPVIEVRLNNIEQKLHNLALTKKETSSEYGNIKLLERKVSDLSKDLDELKSNQKSYRFIIDKAIQSASISAANANDRLKDFYTQIIILFTVSSLLITVFVFLSERKLKKQDLKVEEIDKQNKKVEKSLEKISELIRTLGEHSVSMELIRKEVTSIHKLIDFRQNYDYLCDSDFKPLQHVKLIEEQAKNLWDTFIEINDEKPSKINTANISYIEATLGVIYFEQGMFEKAHGFFKSSYENNVLNREDRVLNFACTAALLFSKSKYAAENHYEEFKSCYLEMRHNEQFINKLRSQSEVDSATLNRIDRELGSLHKGKGGLWNC